MTEKESETDVQEIEEETAVEEKPAEETPVEEAEEPKKKKIRKVVRRRKTKKEKERPLAGAVRLAVESGKVEFGARTGIAASLLGKAKLFVMAANTPPETREKLVSYAKTANIPVLEFEGTSMELGSVCGKPFPVSVLSVFEEGTSSIMDLAKAK